MIWLLIFGFASGIVLMFWDVTDAEWPAAHWRFVIGLVASVMCGVAFFGLPVAALIFDWWF